MKNSKKLEEKGLNPLRLRDAAKEKLKRSSDRLPDLQEKNPEDLIHELRVHQVELEMQNEELRRTQGELEASQKKYYDLYDLAPVGYLTLNEKGLFQEANLTAAALLGVVKGALGKQLFTNFILPEDQDIYYGYRKRLKSIQSAQKKQGPAGCELRMKKKDGLLFLGGGGDRNGRQ
ncbi:MAG: PAS domain-containing protein [Syntrophales bacterium LBB04]|nr:PAS domain-containing protein [Syntrophales bacterium LBB04]